MNLQQRSIHFSPLDKLKLTIMAKKLGVTEGEVVRLALRGFWKRFLAGKVRVLPPLWARKFFPVHIRRYKRQVVEG